MAEHTDMLNLVVEFRKLDRKRKARPLTALEKKRYRLLRGLVKEQLGLNDKSQRNDERIKVKLDAAFRTKDAFREAYITNISGGGVFVATEERIPVGTKVRLQMRIGLERFEVDGKVVWVHTGRETAQYKTGCGVKFIDLTPEQKAIVDEAVTRAIEKRIRSQQQLTPDMVKRILEAKKKE